MTPALSIVVPTLDEERTLELLLEDLRALRVEHEVIVSDGGSTDDTVSLAARFGARVLRARRGRGTQLAAGARMAAAPLLCFLHADVRLPVEARRALEQFVAGPRHGAFAFRFRINAPGWRYRAIEMGVWLRVRFFGLPYGDQGLLVSRVDYDAAGGFPLVPIMEDVALVDALRRITTVRQLHAALPSSARRWEREGAFARVWRNWHLLRAYRHGATPASLAAHYQRSSGLGPGAAIAADPARRDGIPRAAEINALGRGRRHG